MARALGFDAAIGIETGSIVLHTDPPTGARWHVDEHVHVLWPGVIGSVAHGLERHAVEEACGLGGEVAVDHELGRDPARRQRAEEVAQRGVEPHHFEVARVDLDEQRAQVAHALLEGAGRVGEHGRVVVAPPRGVRRP
jgi:hypothetical protein